MANLIREIRLRKGLTQRQLAEALGISQPQLSRVENDHVRQDIARLQRIAEVLGVELSELVLGLGHDGRAC